MAWSEWVPGSTRPDDYPSAAELAADEAADRADAQLAARDRAVALAAPPAEDDEPYDLCRICAEVINVGDDLCTPCWMREHPRAVSR